MTEEESYQRVYEEMKAVPPSGGLWLKAIAHSNGDENSAKAKYMLFRAAQLRAESRKKQVAETGAAITESARYLGTYTVAVVTFIGASLMVIASVVAVRSGVVLLLDSTSSAEGPLLLFFGAVGAAIGFFLTRSFLRTMKKL